MSAYLDPDLTHSSTHFESGLTFIMAWSLPHIESVMTPVKVLGAAAQTSAAPANKVSSVFIIELAKSPFQRKMVPSAGCTVKFAWFFAWLARRPKVGIIL